MPSIFDTVNHPGYWDDKYNNNKDGWDLKSPNPVFVKLLNEQLFVKPGKILILGSGKGYDALAAAKAGYDVTTVDFSDAANNFAESLYKQNGVKVTLLNRDIFTMDIDYAAYFDAVYDYTTFCAIDPLRREEFVKKISLLLTTEGVLIAHLFPVEVKPDGPPYGIDIIEYYKMTSKYLNLVLSTRSIPSIKPRMGREVLQIYHRK